MKAWTTSDRAGEVVASDLPLPTIEPGEVLVKVEACGVCRTDLHVIDQELPVHRPGVVPGHQVVGIVHAVGPAVRRLHVGDRVGVAWLRSTCGACSWCREGRENLCPDSRYTGWDAHGGFAEYTAAPEAYVYQLPLTVDPVTTAPLLCAGIIGYRALSRAHLPPGGRLGMYGFGSSAHITARLATAGGAQLFVMTRGAADRELARTAGAVFVGAATDAPPVTLDAAIVFAPAGELVPRALEATRRGGTVVLAGIHMSDIPTMTYRDHLFDERDLRSVTANTRADGSSFLRVANALGVSPTITRYTFEQTRAALDDLRAGRSCGSLVVTST
ncbi:zinc-binding alcohol dehydrogenase family protein [Oerskovia turbata]|uniref:Probable alcohol dehydrogenase AdhA n=1 Tax=Oerskovia turbata TaxID=1713 RepID=A0A4Q1KXH1_9CELL|nr:zinc-dependent alcohol dehydrogenase family protein [Oerskovia turbata]RXR24755.1 zinc-binding alcohol dehydrogenase family protein [Oerskovia turbata]RXR35041.1 zinc-binding alcohol dehydrogenase family protein [Oerskovia turbata]TGJ97107.1 zinc-binding alcohol dehydrogenase family protein [Actinotalea fermentans ATCC 43279 = JCM 9966 = DSM 3133]